MKEGRKDQCPCQHPRCVTEEVSCTALGLEHLEWALMKRKNLKEKSGRTKNALDSWSFLDLWSKMRRLLSHSVKVVVLSSWGVMLQPKRIDCVTIWLCDLNH